MSARKKIKSCRVVNTEPANLRNIADAVGDLEGVNVQISICGEEDSLKEFDEAFKASHDEDDE